MDTLDWPITVAGVPRMAPQRVEGGWAHCLALMLDEVDYGLLLLDAQGQARLLNRSARQELDARHPLHLVGGHVHARSRSDMVALASALAAAMQRGQRGLMTLGEGSNRVSVAVVPLGANVLDCGPATMLLLGKREVGDSLPVPGFADGHKLTPAETRVLSALCAGEPPAKIAERLGVRISTVRSHIGGLRDKTGARSIRALVRMVAVLPPVAPALRDGAGLAGALLDSLHCGSRK